MKIIQIAIDSSDNFSTLGYIYGLGEDNKIYTWDLNNAEWKFAQIVEQPEIKRNNELPF